MDNLTPDKKSTKYQINEIKFNKFCQKNNKKTLSEKFDFFKR